MRILFINSVCYGSTGTIVKNLIKEYEAQGHDCAIAYGRGKLPIGFYSFKIGNRISFLLHVISNRVFDNHGLCSKYATKKLVKWIESYNPDMIWLHNIHGYYLNYPILFKYLSKTKAKVKWTLHDCWSFTGHCAYFDYANCEKWKTKCFDCPSKKDYPTSFLIDRSKKNFLEKKEFFTTLPKERLELITPSNWLANLVQKWSFLSKYDISIENNKIDTNVFKPTPNSILQKYKIADKKVILGVASVWDRRKGLNDFIELNKILPDGYKIVLIGLNKKQIKKIPRSICAICRTNNQMELVYWYSSAYCLFNPTHEDNYPTILLEAKACGCKIITYDTGGCKEIIGSNDVLLKTKDYAEILNHLD